MMDAKQIRNLPAGSFALTTYEVDLTNTANCNDGSFDITGLSGLTAGKQVLVFNTVGPYTGKSNLDDDFNFDAMICAGYVLNSTTIRIKWKMVDPSAYAFGNYKFSYIIG